MVERVVDIEVDQLLNQSLDCSFVDTTLGVMSDKSQTQRALNRWV
jgi:hypothetical protein